MKFKAIFYPLICVAIVFAIATFLVVKNKIDKSNYYKSQTRLSQQIDDETLPNSTDENDNQSGDDFSNDEDDDKFVLPIQPEQEFATDLKLNCSSTIEMAINETVVLKDYLTVKPKKFFNDTKIEIISDNKQTNDLTFKNGTITASKTGFYKICFSINTSKTKIKTEVLSVIVQEMCSHIELKTNKLELGKIYSIDDIINNKTASEVSVNFDNKYLRFKSNKLTTLKEGTTTIEIGVTSGNVICCFEFNIIIFKPTVCKIVLPDYLNENCIETSKNMLGINYQIMYGDAEFVDQTIQAELSDDTIACIMFSDAPMIYVKKFSKGRVTLKLTSAANPTITKTIVIEFD